MTIPIMTNLRFLTSFLLLVLCIGNATAWNHTEIYQDNSVITFHNETDFATLHASFPYLLVHFMAPWCGYDKSFTPYFINQSNSLRDDYPDVYERARLAVVSCFPDVTSGRKIPFCSDNQGYLTTTFYTPVGKFDYPRFDYATHEIANFIIRHVASHPIIIASQNDAQVFLDLFNQSHKSNNNEVGILGVFDDVTDSIMIERFINASILLNVTAGKNSVVYRFAITSNATYFEDFDLPSQSITIFKSSTHPSTFVEDLYLENQQSMVKIIRLREKWSEELKERQDSCSDWSNIIWPDERCIDRFQGQDLSRNKLENMNSVSWMETVCKYIELFHEQPVSDNILFVDFECHDSCYLPPKAINISMYIDAKSCWLC